MFVLGEGIVEVLLSLQLYVGLSTWATITHKCEMDTIFPTMHLTTCEETKRNIDLLIGVLKYKELHYISLQNKQVNHFVNVTSVNY